MTTAAGTPRTEPASDNRNSLLRLSMTALGVVFGDIGTSPLYAIRECFHGTYGIPAGRSNLLGVLSLIFWAMVLIVGLKYITFVLRADNQGEGGVMALSSLIKPIQGRADGKVAFLLAAGMFGACLLYGDGMITPAISVLSAVEGLGIFTPLFKPYIIPATVAILAALFLLQHRGTTWVGGLFGPVILVWLCAISVLGFAEIIAAPQILAAVSPWYGIHFLIHNQTRGFIALGAVFLAVTGSEALYADMGHFGRRPIRITWFGLVFPALMVNYFGQGALLMQRPDLVDHPFYGLVPAWCLPPMVVLATLATVIASQALITGAFSLTRQAIQLGALPRLKVVHTSALQIGQIYIAPVNWLLMVCTIGLVLGFRTSSKLAAAYGMAVTSTMLITTMLFYAVMRKSWGWKRPPALLVTGVFLLIDLLFFSANMSKVLHGAWFPLVVGAGVFFIMRTWRHGRSILAGRLSEMTIPLKQMPETIEPMIAHKIRGQAVFLTGNPEIVPLALLHNLTHNKVIHAETALLHSKTENIPFVPNREKVRVEKLGPGLYRISARHGFMEEPKMNRILALAQEKGLDFTMEKTSFYLGREKLNIGRQPIMGRWRSHLFIFLSRNSLDAASYYGIPPRRVIEVGIQLEL
jgi:KUP system potassium uptake protein